MKNRSGKKPARKTYAAPKLVVYGKVVDLTQARGKGGRGRKRGGGPGRGKGGGHGGSRS